jgi:hypothetical protein
MGAAAFVGGIAMATVQDAVVGGHRREQKKDSAASAASMKRMAMSPKAR